MKKSPVRLVFGVGLLVLFTHTASAQWVQTNGPFKSVSALAVNGAYLFAGTIDGGIYRTADNGETWTAVNTGLPAEIYWVDAFTVSGGYLFAGTQSDISTGYGGGIYRTADDGASWTAVNTGLPIGAYTGVYSLAVNGAYLFAGTRDSGIYRTADNGATWTVVNTGIPKASQLPYLSIRALAVSGGYFFAGGSGAPLPGGIYRTADNGATWTAVNTGLPANTTSGINAFAASGGYLFAGVYSMDIWYHMSYGIYRTADNGATWILNAAFSTYKFDILNGGEVEALGASGGFLFAGTIDAGIYRSMDNGATWAAANTGFPLAQDGYTTIDAFAVSGGYLFAGIYGNCVWRRSLSELPVQLDSPRHSLLKTMSRAEYMHEAITVHYAVESPCDITVGIYTINGKRIAFSKREIQNTVENSFEVNTGRLPAGLYICKFQAGSYQNSSRFMAAKE
jgi:photosystem II stability/assembly factor-like uncharacterized protein